MNWTAVTQPLKGSFKQAHSFYQGHVHTNADVMKRRIFLHESAFRPHEASESAHGNRIF